ncbi:aminotransferase class III-fold pyridoxal phosphate-dependent enzyme [Pseudomonas pergaminensis]
MENLKIIEEEGLVQHAAQMGIILRKGLQQFADHPMVGEVRGVGLIAAVELVADRHTKEPFEAVGRLAVSVLSGPGAWNDQPSHGRCIGILSSVDLNGEGYQ